MPSNFVRRAVEATGVQFVTFDDGASGPASQGVTLCDSNGSALSTLAVTGPLTDTELRATPVGIVGTATEGATASTAAHVVAGVDTLGDVRQILTLTNGALVVNDGGSSLAVDGTVALGTLPDPTVSTNNSTSTVPTTGTPFTGTVDDISLYAQITVGLHYETSGAHTGTLFLENSHDGGSTWVAIGDGLSFSVAGATSGVEGAPPRVLTVTATHFRVRYVPDDNNLTTFQLNTRYHPFQNKDLTSRLNQAITSNVDVQNVRAILVGQDPSGNFQNVPTNDRGDLITADFMTEVAKGNVTGHALEFKFGLNLDIDTTSDPEDVWAGGGVYTGQPDHADSAETVEVNSDDAADTSAGTGARTLRIYGLDENWEEQTEDFTMNGVSFVAGALLWKRVFRARVLTAGSNGANEGTITVRHTTTTANVFVSLPVGLNRTRIAAYTVPADKTAYVVALDVSLVRANGSAGSGQISFRAREEGAVYEGVYVSSISDGAPVIPRLDKAPLVLQEKTDVTVRVDSVSDDNSQVSASFAILLVDN